MSYDPSTDVGRVRLLVGDGDDAARVFSDAEYTAFLAMEGSVRLAAALAYETIAREKGARLAKTLKIGGYQTTEFGPDEMLAAAQRLRDQDAESAGYLRTDPDSPDTLDYKRLWRGDGDECL